MNIKEVLVFNHCNTYEEEAAVINHLNVKWDVRLDEIETPLVYDPELHCFFEKDLNEIE